MVAMLWRGRRGELVETTRYFDRTTALREALARCGLDPQPMLYDEESAGELQRRLRGASAALVWVDPLSNGRDRDQLNEMLRALERSGVWVSARPDVIDAIGTKRVIFDCQDMSWGVSCLLHTSGADLRASLARDLADGSTRVLKPLRGNGGVGVWKVGPARDRDHVLAQDAARRDEFIEHLGIDEFVRRFDGIFDGSGAMVDQAYIDGVGRGMVRAYISGSTPVGFASQSPAVSPKGELSPAEDPVFAMSAAKSMFPADSPNYSSLREHLEDEWLPEMMARFSLVARSMPAIWDLDFLCSARTGEPRYSLCEINVSCVSPFPGFAADAIAQTVADSAGC
jgi:hypothetical protein